MTLTPTTAPQDMDTGAMLRRAHERGTRLESHDPDQLVADVYALLESKGLHPDLPPGTGRYPMAAGAAGQLLRAFGILPAGDHTTVDRVNAPDPQSR
ncbi:MAG TPA: hypothetical protein VJT31_17535 [Rugosimonospora sp.]|nr:hypothetical protein [Rugosimonospora sp.]